MDNVPILVPRIVQHFERDEPVWTEGLQWYGGYLYESVGLDPDDANSPSLLQQIRLEYGVAVVEEWRELPPGFMGEGLARQGDTLYQLSEVSATQGQPTLFQYGLEPLTQAIPRTYSTKLNTRWGLCFDPVNAYFYLSDGSGTLYVYEQLEDILNDAWADTLTVNYPGQAVVANLNSLAYANGSIYAAWWVQNRTATAAILQIDPQTGNVLARIDATNLKDLKKTPSAQDLNGIAYYYTDTDGQDVFLVTGKRWLSIFAVKFVEKPKP